MTDSTAVDERHVAAVAAQLHDLTCRALFPAGTDPAWTEQHRDMDRRNARRVLKGLHGGGWQLTLRQSGAAR